MNRITIHLTDLKRILELKEFIEAHGGKWAVLNHGAHSITLPTNATQLRWCRLNEHIEVFMVYSVDGAVLEHHRVTPEGIDDTYWSQALTESILKIPAWL